MTGGQTEQVLPCLQPMGLTAGPLPSSSAEEDRLTIQTSEAYACWGLGATGKGVWTLPTALPTSSHKGLCCEGKNSPHLPSNTEGGEATGWTGKPPGIAV